MFILRIGFTVRWEDVNQNLMSYGIWKSTVNLIVSVCVLSEDERFNNNLVVKFSAVPLWCFANFPKNIEVFCLYNLKILSKSNVMMIYSSA